MFGGSHLGDEAIERICSQKIFIPAIVSRGKSQLEVAKGVLGSLLGRKLLWLDRIKMDPKFMKKQRINFGH